MKKRMKIVFVTLFALSIAINIAVITLLVLSYKDYRNVSAELEETSAELEEVKTERDAYKIEARNSSEDLDSLWGVFAYTMNYIDEDKLRASVDDGPEWGWGEDFGETDESEKPYKEKDKMLRSTPEIQ